MTYPTVSFAGYSMPHPLDHYFVLNIQTMGACNPTDVLRLSLLHLSSTLHTLKNDFEAEIVRYRTKEIDFESEIVRYRKMELDFEDQPIY